MCAMRGNTRPAGRLGPVGLAARLVVTAVVVVTVALGTLVGNDGWWPFAPMSQYAFSVRNDGLINSPTMEALTTDGQRVRVALSKDGIGMERAEVEGQLGRFVENPSLMQNIAVLHRRRQPHETPYAVIYLVNRQTRIEGERVETTTTLAEWTVVNPENPEAGL
jgi:hypothetical protein